MAVENSQFCFRKCLEKEGKAGLVLKSGPVRDVVQDIFFNQGLDFSFFGIDLSGGYNRNGILRIKPADLFTVNVINSKNASVELMGVFFFLDGTDDL